MYKNKFYITTIRKWVLVGIRYLLFSFLFKEENPLIATDVHKIYYTLKNCLKM